MCHPIWRVACDRACCVCDGALLRTAGTFASVSRQKTKDLPTRPILCPFVNKTRKRENERTNERTNERKREISVSVCCARSRSCRPWYKYSTCFSLATQLLYVAVLQIGKRLVAKHFDSLRRLLLLRSKKAAAAAAAESSHFTTEFVSSGTHPNSSTQIKKERLEAK